MSCQWLDNVDVHLFAKCDQNMPCRSRVMSFFSLTGNGRKDSHSDYSAHPRVVQLSKYPKHLTV